MVGALWAPLARGSDEVPLPPDTSATTDGTTTRTSTPTGVITEALAVRVPARRLPAMQVTETLPPPTTTATAPGDSLDIPQGSGSGRRVVYSKSVMRVWIIEDDGTLFHTHRVSGLDSQPNPGTYSVWSRSERTCSRSSPDICMRFMVRFAFSRRGDNIGFHEIPRRNGVPLQDLSQLGLAISGGCVRQSTDDAVVMWNWAQLGTVVVVLP
jgi:lipoprotein-anchoring transpeptidase ErfK/SrfK